GVAIDSEAIDPIADVAAPRGGTWASDGTILFAPNVSGPLFRVRATGGPAEQATTLVAGQNDHRAPVLLPGERHFLYYARGTPDVRGVYIARIDGSDPRRLLDADAPAVYASSGHLLFPRQGQLFAQTFDPVRLELTGTAIRVADAIAVNQGVSLASLTASASGGVAYAKSGVIRSQFTWFGRSGEIQGTLGAADANGIA